MPSLLNKNRPPVFCPGCAHETVTRALDKAFENLQLQGSDIVMVSDIGCSGLFDTFFNTHAFHGLHGHSRNLGDIHFLAGHNKIVLGDLEILEYAFDGRLI